MTLSSDSILCSNGSQNSNPYICLYYKGLVQQLKNPPEMKETGDAGSIPGLEISPGGGHSTHCSILAWKIPFREEPGELWSMRYQKSRTRLNGLNALKRHRTKNTDEESGEQEERMR